MADPSNQELTRQDIAASLRHLGLMAGAQVMLHSSLKSFGPVQGGPETIIRAIMEVLTPQGTLMMPSFNHGQAFAAGSPGFFDPATTATANGIIPQLFWQMEGVVRSLHPTHSFAAWGKYGAEYTRNHHRTLTCGPDSPLGRLAPAGGFGLLLGVTYRANTYHHVVEMSLRVPCLAPRSEDYPVKVPGGRIVQGRTWGWRDKGCPITDSGIYAKEMARRNLHCQTTIGQSTATLFRLADCKTVVMDLLTNGYEDYPPCAKCPIRPLRNDRTVPSDWDTAGNCLRPDSTAWSY